MNDSNTTGTESGGTRHSPLVTYRTPVAAVALACAIAVTAGCGSGEPAADSAGAPREASAAAPTFPVWTCEDFGDDDQVAITFSNESSTQVTLRSPQPAACEPWSGNRTPGQVNAEGAIPPGGSRTVTMSYDGLTDSPGTTQRTPLGIEVYLPTGRSSWVGAMPKLEFIRSVSKKGRYTHRQINIFVPATNPGPEVGRYECSATTRLPSAGGAAYVGVLTCSGKLVLDAEPAAVLVVREAPKG